jgi:hypothetical protein
MAKKKPTRGGVTAKRKTPASSPRPPNQDAVINRDVALQSKGPRLQRLRAVLFLIRALSGYPETNFLACVEFQGDVFATRGDTNQCEEYHEENKNYDPDIAFSMNSNEVLNTLVSFCDCWIGKQCSKTVKFGFYTPNHFTKERTTQANSAAGIVWPDDPILAHLSAEQIDDSVLKCAKAAIIAEYEVQAKKHKNAVSDTPGLPLVNLERIRRWDDARWRDFFGQIEWRFGEDDTESIIPTIVDAIQRSPFYNEQLANREGQIISALLNLIDSRQVNKDAMQRFVYASDVRVAFMEVSAGTVLLSDPAWEAWEQLAQPTDSRNLADKVTNVCPNVSTADLARWTRKAASSLIEQQTLAEDKRVLSLKFRIFDACEETLQQLKASFSQNGLTNSEVNDCLAKLVESAKLRYRDCTQTYNYSLKSEDSIQSMVYALFEGCFLNFDGEPTP